MTPRAVKEWVGKRPESMPGKLVKLRIYAKQNGLCACGCTTMLDLNRENSIHCDHIKPLADGGENIESNLQLMHAEHHVEKTKVENSQRSEARRHQARAFTRPPTKWQSQGFPRSRPQRSATSPLSDKFQFLRKGDSN